MLAQTEFQLQVNKHTRRPELLDAGNAAICSVLSRVPGGCRSCWGLHFRVTQQNEKQTHSTCLSSSPLHKHRWEERTTLLHLCHGCAALAKRRAGAAAWLQRAASVCRTKAECSQAEEVLGFTGPILNHFSACRIKPCFEYVLTPSFCSSLFPIETPTGHVHFGSSAEVQIRSYNSTVSLLWLAFS